MENHPVEIILSKSSFTGVNGRQYTTLSETSDIEAVAFEVDLFGLAKEHRGCHLWERLGITCTSAVSCRSAEAYRCSTVASGSCMTNKQK